MFVDSLENRGLSYFTKNKARKVELTPFGRIKKKHKVLWHGTKAQEGTANRMVDDVDNLYV